MFINSYVPENGWRNPVQTPDRAQFKALLGGADRRLSSAVGEFNFLPSRYAHPSWLACLPHGALLVRLRDSPRIAQRLSRHLLAEWELEDRYCFDFSARPARLALIDGAVLARLVLYAGLTATASYARRAVERDKVAAIKRCIGAPAFLFALKRAPFLGGAAPAPTDLRQQTVEAFHAASLAAGMRQLAACLQEQEPALLQRLLFKLPKDWRDWFTPREPCAPQSAGERLFTQLIVELEPQWKHLVA
ncbi:MAG: SctK family type III secretion system sorting platform protein [Gammaproteobacteria bacterium]